MVEALFSSVDIDSGESEDTVRQTLYVKFTPTKKNISVSL
jgi:hypothetical protein